MILSCTATQEQLAKMAPAESTVQQLGNISVFAATFRKFIISCCCKPAAVPSILQALAECLSMWGTKKQYRSCQASCKRVPHPQCLTAAHMAQV
jgi:hypothetical protein